MQATLSKIEYVLETSKLTAIIQFNIQWVATNALLYFSWQQVIDKASELGQESWDLSTVYALCSDELWISIQ